MPAASTADRRSCRSAWPDPDPVELTVVLAVVGQGVGDDGGTGRPVGATGSGEPAASRPARGTTRGGGSGAAHGCRGDVALVRDGAGFGHREAGRDRGRVGAAVGHRCGRRHRLEAGGRRELGDRLEDGVDDHDLLDHDRHLDDRDGDRDLDDGHLDDGNLDRHLDDRRYLDDRRCLDDRRLLHDRRRLDDGGRLDDRRVDHVRWRRRLVRRLVGLLRRFALPSVGSVCPSVGSVCPSVGSVCPSVGSVCPSVGSSPRWFGLSVGLLVRRLGVGGPVRPGQLPAVRDFEVGVIPGVEHVRDPALLAGVLVGAGAISDGGEEDPQREQEHADHQESTRQRAPVCLPGTSGRGGRRVARHPVRDRTPVHGLTALCDRSSAKGHS